MTDRLLERVCTNISMKDFYFHCLKHAYRNGGRYEKFLRRFESE